MHILGIETSCDETAAAVVRGDKTILSNIVISQIEEHSAYGGVVPEIAARAHADYLETVVRCALEESGVALKEMDAIAVTGGPGLIGGVIVGVMAAKAMAAVHKRPFIAVNHLEGHALTVRLTHDVPFPYLLLLVSGGHCQVLAVKGVGQYKKLGGTLDDALGEAFDKTAKMLGLGYPGGPAIESLAQQGNAERFAFPQPLKGREDSNFSFSGLKTAVRTEILSLMEAGALDVQAKADICASFQHTVVKILHDRLQYGLRRFTDVFPLARHMVVAGGVAANQCLRDALEAIAADHGLELVVPPPKLCTDNAAMIAWAGLERLRAGHVDALDFEPRARWPLDAE